MPLDSQQLTEPKKGGLVSLLFSVVYALCCGAYFTVMRK